MDVTDCITDYVTDFPSDTHILCDMSTTSALRSSFHYLLKLCGSIFDCMTFLTYQKHHCQLHQIHNVSYVLNILNNVLYPWKLDFGQILSYMCHAPNAKHARW